MFDPRRLQDLTTRVRAKQSPEGAEFWRRWFAERKRAERERAGRSALARLERDRLRKRRQAREEIERRARQRSPEPGHSD